MKMATEITEGIKVIVETEYQPDYSAPMQMHYVFTYTITIENRSEYTIQLLRRHWLIHDSDGIFREVEGAGVLGKQPIIAPNEIHKYVSGCNLKTDMGKMSGTYLMKRLADNENFDVNIPEFSMIVPHRLN